MIGPTCGRNGHGELLNTEPGSAGAPSDEQVGREESKFSVISAFGSDTRISIC